MTDFAHLLQKIEEADQGSGELSRELLHAVDPHLITLGWMNQTTSVDAITTLIKHVLPGWWHTSGNCNLSCHASIGPDVPGPDAELANRKPFGQGFDADLKQPTTQPLALCHVFIQALQAKAEEGV